MPTEADRLLTTLQAQRDHILEDLEGLSEDDLNRSVLPTGWTALGLVQHLTYDVEQWWFRRVMAGESVEPAIGTGSAWDVAPGTPSSAVLDRYRVECARSDAVVTTFRLDAAPTWWPEELFGSWRLDDLRSMLLHVITETACHAGQLDAVRELLDGRTWLILT